MNTLELACVMASFEVAAGKKRMAKGTIARATKDTQGLVIRDGSTWLNPIAVAIAQGSQEAADS